MSLYNTQLVFKIWFLTYVLVPYEFYGLQQIKYLNIVPPCPHSLSFFFIYAQSCVLIQPSYWYPLKAETFRLIDQPQYNIYLLSLKFKLHASRMNPLFSCFMHKISQSLFYNYLPVLVLFYTLPQSSIQIQALYHGQAQLPLHLILFSQMIFDVHANPFFLGLLSLHANIFIINAPVLGFSNLLCYSQLNMLIIKLGQPLFLFLRHNWKHTFTQG